MGTQYWLHRISHKMDVSYPLLKAGYLSIGFSDFSENGFVERCRGNWGNFEERLSTTWAKGSRNRHALWRFLEMKKDDVVVVPLGDRFNVYKIADDQTYLPYEIEIDDLKTWGNIPIGLSSDQKLHYQDERQTLIDLGFFRKIVPFSLEIPRKEYADGPLTARMKVRQTNVNVNDLKESIKQAVESYKDKRPINLKTLILESMQEETLRTVRENLNPAKFERLIETYFRNVGATDTDIPPKNEHDKKGDADIVAIFDSIKTIIYVQAKFHDGKTGGFAVEQINDYTQHKEESMEDDYSRLAWVITSAKDFSGDAKKKAKENQIRLINGDEFIKMVLEAGINNLNDI